MKKAASMQCKPRRNSRKKNQNLYSWIKRTKTENMNEYIKWLESKIEARREDKDLQREHWAFCKALEKYREVMEKEEKKHETSPDSHSK